MSTRPVATPTDPPTQPAVTQPSYEELFTRNIGFVDENEQALLKTARVAVLGVGGMGGVVAQVLVRAGVGAIHLLDKDAFEPSNNNRQVYARTDTWGRAKAEVTAEELRRINPAADIRMEDHFGADNIDRVLDGVHVVVNGMDELSACVRLWRGARERRIPLVDAWSAPLPNVFVIRPGEPLPEEFLGYPSVGLAPEQLEVRDPAVDRAAKARVDECKLREALHVALHSRSLRYLDMQIIDEILSGQRARISFAPMVWGAGLMMAWEAIKLRLGRGKVASRFGRFWDPWEGGAREARGFLPFELELVRAAWAKVAGVIAALWPLFAVLFAVDAVFRPWKARPRDSAVYLLLAYIPMLIVGSLPPNGVTLVALGMALGAQFSFARMVGLTQDLRYYLTTLFATVAFYVAARVHWYALFQAMPAFAVFLVIAAAASRREHETAVLQKLCLSWLALLVYGYLWAHAAIFVDERGALGALGPGQRWVVIVLFLAKCGDVAWVLVHRAAPKLERLQLVVPALGGVAGGCAIGLLRPGMFGLALWQLAFLGLLVGSGLGLASRAFNLVMEDVLGGEIQRPLKGTMMFAFAFCLALAYHWVRYLA